MKVKIGRTAKETAYYKQLQKHLEKSSGSFLEKIEEFPKYAPRQRLALFLAKYELFQKVLGVQGSIVECGVHLGGGLMTFAQLSAILEPVNYQRQIFGFDTFGGFPGIAREDKRSESGINKKGGLALPAKKFQELKEVIGLFDRNRVNAHIPKVELIKGDVLKTLPKFLDQNPQTVVSLLYLDFDLYEPTKCALEHLLPRMPKGAVVAFDELNSTDWSGETLAVKEVVGINNLRIQRFLHVPKLSFAVIE